jgi:hypothetical protein
VKCLCQSAAARAVSASPSPTLVVGRTTRTAKGHVAVAVAIAHAPARHCHGPVAVGASHCAVGAVVSQVARGPAGDLRAGGGQGRGQLVGEGSVLRVLWWGSVVVGRVVRNFRLWVARGRKGRHVSSARFGTAVQGGTRSQEQRQTVRESRQVRGDSRD